MIFSSKRDNTTRHSSNAEACMSIIGLLLAIGLVGGLSALVYGIIRGSSIGTIAGGVIFGLSAFFSVILALVFVYCLKNNDVDSDENEHRPSVHQRPHERDRRRTHHRPIRHGKSSSHEISVISGTQRYDRHSPPQSLNEYDPRKLSTQTQSIALTDSTNSGIGRQVPQSPSKISAFVFTQSNSLTTNSNPNPPSNTHIKRDNYNRH